MLMLFLCWHHFVVVGVDVDVVFMLASFCCCWCCLC